MTTCITTPLKRSDELYRNEPTIWRAFSLLSIEMSVPHRWHVYAAAIWLECNGTMLPEEPGVEPLPRMRFSHQASHVFTMQSKQKMLSWLTASLLIHFQVVDIPLTLALILTCSLSPTNHGTRLTIEPRQFIRQIMRK